MTKEQIDEQIFLIVKALFSQGTFKVETLNESWLVKLMELRGTPISNYESYRNIETDYELFKEFWATYQ